MIETTPVGPIDRAMASLDQAMSVLRGLDADFAARQKAEAEKLWTISQFHGIKIVEDPSLGPNEIAVHVGDKIWRMFLDLPNLRPATDSPETSS